MSRTLKNVYDGACRKIVNSLSLYTFGGCRRLMNVKPKVCEKMRKFQTTL